MAQVREAAAMKTTIIFAHPWSGSFNRAVLNTVMAAGGNSNLIDLYQDNFNPVMSAPELALYGKGQYIDPLIGRYIAILKETARAIFIFPIWWYDMPAILRGFFDKVMFSGSAYHEDEQGLHPLLNIGRTLLFTTSSTPTRALTHDFGDPINGTIINGTLKALGFNNAQWHNLGLMNNASSKERNDFLAKVKEAVQV